MSYITPQNRTKLVELKLKIRPEVAALLDEYAAWLKSDKGYVVQEVLRKSIAGDKDFQRARKRETAAPEPAKKVKAIA